MTSNVRNWIHPVVIGSGQRLVRGTTCSFRLIDAQACNPDVVVVTYPAALGDEPTPLLDGWKPQAGQSLTELGLAMLGVIPVTRTG